MPRGPIHATFNKSWTSQRQCPVMPYVAHADLTLPHVKVGYLHMHRREGKNWSPGKTWNLERPGKTWKELLVEWFFDLCRLAKMEILEHQGFLRFLCFLGFELSSDTVSSNGSAVSSTCCLEGHWPFLSEMDRLSLIVNQRKSRSATQTFVLVHPQEFHSFLSVNIFRLSHSDCRFSGIIHSTITNEETI